MSTWIIDPDHSVAAFAVRHLGVAFVRGQFNAIRGTIRFDPKDISRASAEATIEVPGLLTGIRKRDDHVLSPDFFDADGYPQMIFRSTGVEGSGQNRARMTGDLTIRGITRTVSMDVEFSGPVKSPSGGETTMGFSATAALDRFDFGISWNEMMEDGGFVVGREVKITLDIEADLKE